MQNPILHHFRAERWLYLFILVHLFFWTLIPALVRYNLPLDSIEGTLWGHQLEWGYDKNPFLNGWLTALAIYLDGQSGWMVYLFSQLSVVICFWAVWRLAKNMMPSIYALFAVLILEGVQYYNFHAIDFNDNTLELSLWALTIYFFYQSLQKGTAWTWSLTGAFAGLGMMAKYYTVALLAMMALMLFSYEDYRKQLATKLPYIGFMVFLAVILPHTIWLFFHDFITVTYVFERGSSKPSWTNHFFFPLQFAWQQLQTFSPAIILAALLLIGKSSGGMKPLFKLSTFNKRFLFFVGLGPFLITLFLSFALGTKLRAGWGMPLLSLWGIILIALLKPAITRRKIYLFIAGIFTLMFVLLAGYIIALTDSKESSSANFPGKEIAATLTSEWEKTFKRPLKYVAGSRWIGGNIGFYSSHHPSVFVEWDEKRAPWIDVKDLEKNGAIFVWEISRRETLPQAIIARFPQLQKATIREFAWLRDKYQLAPVKIGVAILPPQNS